MTAVKNPRWDTYNFNHLNQYLTLKPSLNMESMWLSQDGTPKPFFIKNDR